MFDDSIADIEKRLNELHKFPFQQIARNVGVARFYVMRLDELRESIIAIAKGEVEPIPIYNRHIILHLLWTHNNVNAFEVASVSLQLSYRSSVFKFPIHKHSLSAVIEHYYLFFFMTD